MIDLRGLEWKKGAFSLSEMSSNLKNGWAEEETKQELWGKARAWIRRISLFMEETKGEKIRGKWNF